MAKDKKKLKIGEVLRKWRVSRELPLEEVAKEIGISTATLSRVELGQEMDARTLLAILSWLTSGDSK